MLKTKGLLGSSENALHYGAAFVADLLWRVFKPFGHFPKASALLQK